jgi:glycosyltransferase involved in cell wall biosynthesis
LPLIAAEIYDHRPDLVQAFPGAHIGENQDGFWRWICRHGVVEFQIDFLVTYFRRSLTSDSLVGFSEEIDGLQQKNGLSYRFLGEDRRAAAGWLRSIDRADLSDGLLEAEPEWAFFTDLSALLLVYARRSDLQTVYPHIFGASHEAFATWVEVHSEREHGVPPRAVTLFRTRTAAIVLARIFSFLSRREDLGRLAHDELLSDHPERLFRELMRGSGEGLEYDMDDVEVLRFLHRHERQLIVPLYLELPLVRRQSASSRIRENQMALLPEDVRQTAWAQHGCEIHIGMFRTLERLLEDEIRGQEETAATTHNHVFDVLRSTHRGHGQDEVLSAYRRALRKTRRREKQILESPQSEAETAVNMFGYFLADTGVGESTRGLAQAVGLLRPVTRLAQCTGNLQPGVVLEQLFHHYDYLSDLNIFVSYPHTHENVFGVLPSAYFQHRRNIIHLAWEQQDWNHHWKSIYERYDEIWAISDFAAAPFRELFGANVKVVPNVLNVEEYPDCIEECAARLTHEPFVFLFVFDANSSIERKNPQAVIDAFIKAFKGTNAAQSVRLVLKVSNLYRHEHVPRVEAMIRSAAASGMQIEFDGRQLRRAELLRLVASAGCFVSLHRSEGFGYTMAEAMYYAVPVIASDYSGNLQYMDSHNSFLVPCTECPVEVPDGPFQRGSVWAQPDIDAAADFMRRVVGNRDEARRVGEAGRATVLSKLTAAAVAEGLRDSLLAPRADRGPPLFGAGIGTRGAVPTDGR